MDHHVGVHTTWIGLIGLVINREYILDVILIYIFIVPNIVITKYIHIIHDSIA